MLEDRILFIDAEAIVIDKPAGLPVDSPRAGGDSVAARAGELKLGFHREPVAMHRLDRDTSGCLLLARNDRAHKRFARTFDAGRVEKLYVALLDGVPDLSEGRIDLPLAKISSREQGWRMVPDPGGKPAVTHWRKLAEQGGRALILFTPETGRTHQLRVHAASGLGLPIAGDPVYGTGRGPMLLHARALRVPRDGKPDVETRAPLPAPFREAGFDDDGL
jgi:tRNA pseudouridine32 synthase / 23S rRNA pseudouridine746 synthase